MSHAQILKHFDDGASLERCLSITIESSDDPIVATLAFVREAMEMRDQSGSNVRTPVRSTYRRNAIRVAKGRIKVVRGNWRGDDAPQSAEDVKVRVRCGGSMRSTDYNAASFISTSVVLRAAGRRSDVRSWLSGALAGLPLPTPSTRPSGKP